MYLWEESCGAAVQFPHSTGHSGHHLHTSLVLLALGGIVGGEVRPELGADGTSVGNKQMVVEALMGCVGV